ncbi:MAG: LytTR family DNA-binding domain-containing protein [Bacteroidia bacterium]|nr:LytTR family DNA-binding domain-containing protein [Bacteroidia bacterium]
MLKALIIEDEPLAAKRLSRMLQELEPEMEILDILDSVKSTVNWLKLKKSDVIFLDIHLADGNSFAIFEEVDIETPIIFTTAYDEYAIKAFKLNSIDYLLKPIEREELGFSIKKLKNQIGKKELAPQLDVAALIEAMQAPPKPVDSFQKRFLVTSGDKIKSIPIEEVAYFFGQQKYVFLITQDNRRHIINYTLGQLEDLLDPENFFRINRQFIVGFSSISTMFSYSKSRIKVELMPQSDIEAIVSIDKTPKFKNWLNR